MEQISGSFQMYPYYDSLYKPGTEMEGRDILYTRVGYDLCSKYQSCVGIAGNYHSV